MNLAQPENIYKANGLNDLKLKNTEDLLRVYDISYKDLVFGPVSLKLDLHV